MIEETEHINIYKVDEDDILCEHRCLLCEEPFQAGDFYTRVPLSSISTPLPKIDNLVSNLLILDRDSIPKVNLQCCLGCSAHINCT